MFKNKILKLLCQQEIENLIILSGLLMRHTTDHLMCLHYVYIMCFIMLAVLTNVKSFDKSKLQSLSCLKVRFVV